MKNLIIITAVWCSIAPAADGFDKFFWANGMSTGQVRSADSNGTNIQTVVGSLNIPVGVAVSSGGAHVYFTVAGDDQVKRSNFDGTSVVTLVSSTNDFPTYMDISGGKMYWSQIGGASDAIGRANLNGTSQDLNFIVEGGALGGLAIDASDDKIYYGNGSTQKIRRATLSDGSGATDFITGAGLVNDMDLDLINGYIYWADSSGFIKRRLLSGGSIDSLAHGLGQTRGIALDVSGGRVYFTTDSSTPGIHSALLDLSGGVQTEISLGSEAPQGLALFTMVPEPRLYLLLLPVLLLFRCKTALENRVTLERSWVDHDVASRAQ